MVEARTNDYKKIESHSSYLNNQRLQILFLEADKLALNASRTMHFNDIAAYYETVEHIYLCIEMLVVDKADVEKIRENYAKVTHWIDTDPNCRTRKSLLLMLQYTKLFFNKLHAELQRYEFWFRINISQPKGLKNIRFYNQGNAGEQNGSEGYEGTNDTGS